MALANTALRNQSDSWVVVSEHVTLKRSCGASFIAYDAIILMCLNVVTCSAR